MRLSLIIITILFFRAGEIFSQETDSIRPIKEYNLTIEEQTINITGKNVMGMAVNGTIPGPTLEFIEGEQAVIHVTNNMKMETSVHWHGLLLPNFQDGVPYLTTPPIKPGTTFTYSFPLNQSGTYWYHSHTMLQEQSGVFGSIVIKPKEKTIDYDTDLVVMLSDWTNEKPKNVLRTLKRGTEWYNIKKGTATPLNTVIACGAFGAQVDFWRQRMEGADIADIYYPTFLTNGRPTQEYPQFKPGEKIRLRIINGSASTQFWMTFGGKIPVLVSADGLDVVPVEKNKLFIAIAETYDVIVTIPESGKVELRSMAQDGSGFTTAYFGNGKVMSAEVLPKPDKIAMMKQMANMKMKMGAHALKFQPKRDERFKMKEEYGMQMDGMHDMGKMKMKDEAAPNGKMEMDMTTDEEEKTNHSKMKSEKIDMSKDIIKGEKMDHSKMNMKKMDDMQMDNMQMNAQYNYDYLKSPKKTTFSKDAQEKEILLNLTGNMNRYIWSMNGVPISETDNIQIKSGEVTRITMNNLTMMHHPMHLHGHFFRVLNKNGEYSPLKHTVNVPPMQQVTIEFYGDAYGDWLFHCHVLYHMMSGMTRIFSYDTPRDERMKDFPVSKLINEMDSWYSWGKANFASHMGDINLTASNMRNQFNVMAEYGWNKNIEAEFTYEHYLHDYLRMFGGVNVENGMVDSLDDIETTAIAGVRYLTPYLFDLDVRVDSKLRPQISVGREIMVFPRTLIFSYYEYQADFGLVNTFENNSTYESDTTWSAGVEYLLSKNFSVIASYDNRFGAGGGLSVKF